MTEKVLDKELKKWRETRARKAPQAPMDRRTVRVNGQDVMVIVKTPRKPQG